MGEKPRREKGTHYTAKVIEGTQSVCKLSSLGMSKRHDKNKGFNEEFDPGSGRTLAARLTHASRTELTLTETSVNGDFSLVANG